MDVEDGTSRISRHRRMRFMPHLTDLLSHSLRYRECIFTEDVIVQLDIAFSWYLHYAQASAFVKNTEALE